MAAEHALVETGGEVVRLPMPAHLDRRPSSRSLAMAVCGYFFDIYNNKPNERQWLASVGREDSVTGNRMFDRHYYVLAIKAMAKEAKDLMTVSASDWQIWNIVSGEMRGYGLGLKLRRQQYQLLTHQQDAAA